MPATYPRRPTPIVPLPAVQTPRLPRGTPADMSAVNPAAGDGSVPRTRRIAAIDIGSNSIRAIVADVSPTGQIIPLTK